MPQLSQEQIQQVLSVLDWSDIAPDLQDGIEQATLAGVSTALTGGDVDNAAVVATANDAARSYAQDRAAELVGSGGQSIAATTRDNLREIITQSFEDETDMSDLLSDITDAGIFSPARARMIARTEVQTAERMGNISTWKVMGNVDLVDWLVGPDCCAVCQGFADDGPYSLADAEDLLVETHPNCSCILSPHLEPDEDES